ncbi:MULTISPECIES: helix-turn-helix transcriptional regulator [Streptomyces]|uniref:Transcriptional regulator n=1 Tax=Streptomyces xanthochromogenes TaxID=67384 RepID=A0ABQ2ZVC1_9ACTN|nr:MULTISPECIES: YafY family protein [Streptomyces]MYV89184.1 WYL domain-containing protein [Streptomyces sp. SID1034]GGY25909.1 transcriptional regulator [Streptomyces xanthochromogenes]
MRAARLIKMVLLLQARPAMTAAELARELEVSERTVTRDAQALAEAGVPVYADRGRAGGYRLVGGYRTRLTGLARSEAEVLFLSGVPGALREMGLEDAASAARLKVSAALLPSLKDAPSAAAQRFHLDAPGWWQEPETPELLPAVAEAVWDDRNVRVGYRRPDRPEVERNLEPYGLVLKAGVWYLCARPAEERGDFRVYRLDRFTAVAVGEDRFVRDEGFDLPRFWETRAEEFARAVLRETVVVRVSPAGAALLPYATGDRGPVREALERAGEADEDGRLTLTLPVESQDVAYSQLLSLGPELEVMEPAGLRARFIEAARGLSQLYA